MKKEQLKVYLVTDRPSAMGRNIVSVVQQAVAGGVTMVQLREKSLDTREFVEMAMRLKESLKGKDVPLIINDRLDVALACGADGVHIGQSDMPYGIARQLLGRESVIGLSVENGAQLAEANGLDVDYVAASPVFATPTKTDTAAPWGLEGLRTFVRDSVHPVVAIGGMNASTAPAVFEVGADGIAVVSAIISAASPFDAAKELKSLSDKWISRK